jgi:hypothetical protein
VGRALRRAAGAGAGLPGGAGGPYRDRRRGPLALPGPGLRRRPCPGHAPGAGRSLAPADRPALGRLHLALLRGRAAAGLAALQRLRPPPDGQRPGRALQPAQADRRRGHGLAREPLLDRPPGRGAGRRAGAGPHAGAGALGRRAGGAGLRAGRLLRVPPAVAGHPRDGAAAVAGAGRRKAGAGARSAPRWRAGWRWAWRWRPWRSGPSWSWWGRA